MLDVYQAKAKAGQPIILFQASNSDPGQDFTISFQGTVNDFYKAGLVSSSLNLHYSKLWAYEIEYSPYGADSGYCVGVGSTAVDGTGVALEPCGQSAKTVWVVDSYASIKGHFVPLINGSDTNFSHPYVLNYPGNAYPTDKPRAAADHLDAVEVLQPRRLQQPDVERQLRPPVRALMTVAPARRAGATVMPGPADTGQPWFKLH